MDKYRIEHKVAINPSQWEATEYSSDQYGELAVIAYDIFNRESVKKTTKQLKCGVRIVRDDGQVLWMQLW